MSFDRDHYLYERYENHSVRCLNQHRLTSTISFRIRDEPTNCRSIQHIAKLKYL